MYYVKRFKAYIELCIAIELGQSLHQMNSDHLEIFAEITLVMAVSKKCPSSICLSNYKDLFNILICQSGQGVLSEH